MPALRAVPSDRIAFPLRAPGLRSVFAGLQRGGRGGLACLLRLCALAALWGACPSGGPAALLRCSVPVRGGSRRLLPARALQLARSEASSRPSYAHGRRGAPLLRS